jgi:hypothetical protein
MTSSTPARKARLKRRARRLGLGAVALIAIAAAVAMVVVIRSRDSVVPLNPDLVAVATLTNETGDATLAPLGRMAAERIAQGVQQQGVADVVPPTLALAAAEEVRDASDPAAAFARATGAGVVLHGAYYLLGDSLQFQLQITDVVDGKLMSALAPVTGPREPATESLDLVRERVLGTLAAALDLRSGVLHVPMQPRSLELYRVFQQADDAEIRGDREEALRLYRAAWAMDSTFYPALVLAAAWVRTMGRFGGGDSLLAEGDSLFRLADGFRDRMSEAERLFLQLFHAAGAAIGGTRTLLSRQCGRRGLEGLSAARGTGASHKGRHHQPPLPFHASTGQRVPGDNDGRAPRAPESREGAGSRARRAT